MLLKMGGTIGDNTCIAVQCYIIDMDHGIKKSNLIRKQENTVSPVFIGNDVWIAADITVLKGTVINDGAVIGAKSMVKGEIESFSVCVGVPATKIKIRN